MELLVNAGSFQILAQPQLMIEDKNIGEPFHKIIKKTATVCYQSEENTKKNAIEFTEMLRKIGHWSMFDHVSITVKFLNCSRGFTHELCRHRIAAYAQESTRFVDESNLKLVGPPHKDCINEHMQLENPPFKELKGTTLSFQQMGELIECFYRTLKEHGWKNEDARQLLPIGVKSEIIMTADFTEWRHVFALRTQKNAHWEIRSIMIKLLKEFKKLFSPIFDDFKLAGKDENGLEYYQIKED